MSGQLKPPVSADDHAQGDTAAPVTLVEFGDYQCPYCGQAYGIIKKLQAHFGKKLRFVFRNFPLNEAHPNAMAAAEIAEAAALQGKFWEMHDMLYEHQDALDAEDLTGYAKLLHLDMAKVQGAIRDGSVVERIKADFNHGVRSGVNGTPAFYINGTRFDGNWTDANELVAAIEAAG